MRDDTVTATASRFGPFGPSWRRLEPSAASGLRQIKIQAAFVPKLMLSTSDKAAEKSTGTNRPVTNIRPMSMNRTDINRNMLTVTEVGSRTPAASNRTGADIGET